MAQAIPIYGQQVQPNQVQSEPTAQSAVSATNPLATAAMGFGKAAEGLVNEYARQDAIQKKKDEAEAEQNALNITTNLLSEDQLFDSTFFTEKSQQWKVGDPDLQTVIGTELNKRLTDNLVMLPTDKARDYYLQHRTAAEVRMKQAAIEFQTKRTSEQLNADTELGVQADLKTVSLDPSYDNVVGTVKRRMVAINNDPNMSDAQKQLANNKIQQSYSFAAEESKMTADPQAWLKNNVGILGNALAPAELPSLVGGKPYPVGIDALSRALKGQEWNGEGPAPDSQTGAVGANQIQPDTFNGLKRDGLIPQSADIRNAADNDLAHFALLKQMQDAHPTWGNEQLAAAYYGGPKAVRADGSIKRDQRPNAGVAGPTVGGYVDSIMARMAKSKPTTDHEQANAVTGEVHTNPAAISPTFALLDLDKQQALIEQAKRLSQQQQAQYQGVLKDQVRDESAMNQNGVVGANELKQTDFQSAYGKNWVQPYKDYQQSRQMGADIGAYKTMTPAQIQADIDNNGKLLTNISQGKGTGYAEADARQNIRIQAATAAIKMQQDDPINYASKNSLGLVPDLDFANPATLGAQLAKRVPTAELMNGQYQTKYTLLKDGDKEKLSLMLRNLPDDNKIALLRNISKNLNNDVAYTSLMREIAPDSPVTAGAGKILGGFQPMFMSESGFMFKEGPVYLQRGDAMKTMLRGEQLLNPTKTEKGQDGKGKYPMPPDKKMQAKFDEATRGAFAGDPLGMQQTYEMFKAYYAGKQSDTNSLDTTVVDENTANEAIAASTGGIIDFRGNGKVAKPWGMPDDKFEDTVADQFHAAMVANKFTGSPIDRLDSYALQLVSSNRYALRMGKDVVRNRDNSPVIIDFTKPVTVTKPKTVTRVPNPTISNAL